MLRGNKQITPFFIAIRFTPSRSNFTVLDTALLLGNNIWIVELVFSLYLHQIDRAFRFHNKVWLIVAAMVIGDIELFRVRTKPILDIVICLQNASQRQFSVFAIKFSCAKNASLNTCKKYRSDLRLATGISTTALAKLGKNEHVSTEILTKICKALDCDFCDIIELVKEENEDACCM